MEGTEAGAERKGAFGRVWKKTTKETLKRNNYVSLMGAKASTQTIKTWVNRKLWDLPGEVSTAGEHGFHAAQAGPSSTPLDLPLCILLLMWSASRRMTGALGTEGTQTSEG